LSVSSDNCSLEHPENSLRDLVEYLTKFDKFSTFFFPVLVETNFLIFEISELKYEFVYEN